MNSPPPYTHITNWMWIKQCLPPNPAPATPNKDPMMATPAVDPRAAAPAPPMIEAAPAATKGAAKPPVNPKKKNNLTSTEISNSINSIK